MGSQGGFPWDHRVGTHGIPRWAPGEHGRAPGNASELCDEHKGVRGNANERAGERRGTSVNAGDGCADPSHRQYFDCQEIMVRTFRFTQLSTICLQWVLMEPQNHPTAIQKNTSID